MKSVMKVLILLLSLITANNVVNSKIYDRCELAHELRYQHHIPLEQVAIWVCIAQYQSGFNTSALALQADGGYHGMFQISDVYWCSPWSFGKVCEIDCARLRDDNLFDDFLCMDKIYIVEQRISGDGYNAWPAYKQHCNYGKSDQYVSHCFSDDGNSVVSQSNSISGYQIYQSVKNFARTESYGVNSVRPDSISSGYEKKKTSKVNGRCELARELLYRHQMPMEQIANWVCVAYHESNYKQTSAIGRLNADGSDDHGLLKINEIYVATYAAPPSYFNVPAKIAKKSKLTGKVYDRCELARELKYVHNVPDNQIATWVCIVQHETSYNTSAVGSLNADGSRGHGLFQISDLYWCSPPGNIRACGLTCAELEDGDITNDVECVRRIHEEHTHISGDGFNGWAVYSRYCKGRAQKYIDGCFEEGALKTNTPTTDIPDTKSLTKPNDAGKVYDRCELARELKYVHNAPDDQIATWVCIVQHETSYNTSAVGSLNADGSSDHGLFQINDRYWCSPPGNGTACGLTCAELEDGDITNDVECVRRIHEEHTSISGDGFNGWAVYSRYCKGRAQKYIDGCFEEGALKTNKPKIDIPDTKSLTKPNDAGKVYDRCELARELKYVHNVPDDQIATWVCIVQHEAIYNTSAVGRLNADGSSSHGLFQINDLYWCSPPGNGTACGLTCAELEDGDITNDVECVRRIHEEHTSISGDGFNGWAVYSRYCKGRAQKYIDGCFEEGALKTNKPKIDIPDTKSLTKPNDAGKVYDRCELARELKYVHNVPDDQIATWVCIVQHEASYNTSAVGRLNADGSSSHGLFQISDRYWCSPPGNGTACGLTCAELEDGDITNDVECVRRIHEEHTSISGDGFNGWAVYSRYCKGRVQKYIDGCFEEGDLKTNTATTTDIPDTKTLTKLNDAGKVYDRCELARELKYVHNVPDDQIATWVCIVQHETSYNTSAVGSLNTDGSSDHGLFQISDLYWCSPPGNGQACGLTCAELEDGDITNDVECVRRIHEEHTSISGDGFNGWAVYSRYCKGRAQKYIDGCFEEGALKTNKPKIDIPDTQSLTKPNDAGKVYDRCELARELKFVHNVPDDQIATWVCIVQHEASYNTSAVGRLNADGSSSHGLFQISDRYWCSPPGNGTACGLTCAEFEDGDITNDVECVRRIHEEHTRISGDGFNAWVVYSRYCKGRVQKYIDGCFEEGDLKTNTATTTDIPDTKTLTKLNDAGKVYDRCELARELKYVHNVPDDQIATWVCIVQHETSYNTSAVGSLNADGSSDHGLFQISNLYWCSPPGNGQACGLTCAELEDGDITNDVECVRRIHEEHTSISGDGFNGWAVYSRYCKGRAQKYIDGCFEEGALKTNTPKADIHDTKPVTKLNVPGKVYDRCELARELKNVHNISDNQIATWVCIARHESNFNTSAVERLYINGSGDHGIFQISDRFWCDQTGNENACGLACSALVDNDIKDDVACAKKIYEEHTRISGDGFNAWSVYAKHCKGNTDNYITDCFTSSTYRLDEQQSSITSTTTVSAVKKYYPDTPFLQVTTPTISIIPSTPNTYSSVHTTKVTPPTTSSTTAKSSTKPFVTFKPFVFQFKTPTTKNVSTIKSTFQFAPLITSTRNPLFSDNLFTQSTKTVKPFTTTTNKLPITTTPKSTTPITTTARPKSTTRSSIFDRFSATTIKTTSNPFKYISNFNSTTTRFSLSSNSQPTTKSIFDLFTNKFTTPKPNTSKITTTTHITITRFDFDSFFSRKPTTPASSRTISSTVPLFWAPIKISNPIELTTRPSSSYTTQPTTPYTPRSTTPFTTRSTTLHTKQSTITRNSSSTPKPSPFDLWLGKLSH